jgi:hypothetical protein
MYLIKHRNGKKWGIDLIVINFIGNTMAKTELLYPKNVGA